MHLLDCLPLPSNHFLTAVSVMRPLVNRSLQIVMAYRSTLRSESSAQNQHSKDDLPLVQNDLQHLEV